MFPHVFGAAARDSKDVGRRDKLDLLLQGILRRMPFSNVLIAGMSGFQQIGTWQRRSARIEKKRGKIIVQDLPGANLSERWQTSSRLEGDVIVMSLDEHTPTNASPGEAAGSIFLETPEGADMESEGVPNVPMAPSTRLRYSRFQGDGSQYADDWFCEFQSIATANHEDPESKRRIFQGLLKGEALKWYQDVPDKIREDWTDFTQLFLKTFREAGGEARTLRRLSRMTKKPDESVRKHGQRVKALIQKLTADIAKSVQVEWYVAGFSEKMGFQIRQTCPDTLREAMEAAQNYVNSAQSLQKSLKKSEERGKANQRRRWKYSSSSESNSNSKSETTTSASSSSKDDTPMSSKNQNRHFGSENDRKGKELFKVKVEEDDSRRMMKNIQDTSAAIQVNLTESRKPKTNHSH